VLAVLTSTIRRDIAVVLVVDEDVERGEQRKPEAMGFKILLLVYRVKVWTYTSFI
jgi:hypothetical protein